MEYNNIQENKMLYVAFLLNDSMNSLLKYDPNIIAMYQRWWQKIKFLAQMVEIYIPNGRTDLTENTCQHLHAGINKVLGYWDTDETRNGSISEYYSVTCILPINYK